MASQAVQAVLWDADGVLQNLPAGWEASMRPAVGHLVDDVEGFLAAAFAAERPCLTGDARWVEVLPRLLEAVRLQVGPAMVYLLAAEWNNTDIGFGFRLRVTGRLLQMNVVYVYLVYLGLVGLAIDYSLTFLRRKLCPWFGE